MKVIIISDIKGKGESIISYGLNLAKNLESEVLIIHTIDSRTLHGIQSSYSDSQTVSHGNKLSHKNIVYREKDCAEKEIHRVLSKEASKLNYPLKINTMVEQGSIESKLREIVKSDKQCILIINAEPDQFIFHSKQAILDAVYNLDTASLIIPGGMSFHDFNNTFLLTNPAPRKIKRLKKKISFLKNFNPVINAIHIVRKKKYDRIKQKHKVLESMLKDRFTPFEFKTITLAGKKYITVLSDFLEKESPDLIIHSVNRKNIFKSLLQKKRCEKIINNTRVPLLLLS